jgi:hypothetical protein
MFIWGTVEAFQSDNTGVGTVLSIFSFGFYAGNVYGSIESAQRRNSKLQKDLLAQFKIGFLF